MYKRKDKEGNRIGGGASVLKGSFTNTGSPAAVLLFYHDRMSPQDTKCMNKQVKVIDEGERTRSATGQHVIRHVHWTRGGEAGRTQGISKLHSPENPAFIHSSRGRQQGHRRETE